MKVTMTNRGKMLISSETSVEGYALHCFLAANPDIPKCIRFPGFGRGIGRESRSHNAISSEDAANAAKADAAVEEVVGKAIEEALGIPTIQGVQ